MSDKSGGEELMSILKPCPFCGGEAEIAIYLNQQWTIKCTKCFCEISSYDLDSDEMIKAWNRRQNDCK